MGVRGFEPILGADLTVVSIMMRVHHYKHWLKKDYERWIETNINFSRCL